ncbi:MAG: DNA repair protein RecN [Actinomycetota bacterium]|nr:DNA repair protein RecN [Actinomycetota bacterium]
MLLELAVTDLGVISELSLVLSPGMTAVTGETGAGKTLVVTALELLAGARADATVVRPGADEARVDGRFVGGAGDEVVLTRVVPADGRSRAYVGGRPAPVAALTERGAALVELHGQHSHQSLLSPSAQRAALDHFGGVDVGPLRAARRRLAGIEAELRSLGGDADERARQADLLRFEVDELHRAGLDHLDEEEELEEEEDLLASAAAHRQAAGAAHAALTDERGAQEALAAALGAVTGLRPFRDVEQRLRALAAEVADVATDLRHSAEAIEEDPARLEAVRQRRQLLRQLRRKHGAATMAELVAVAGQRERALEELLSSGRRYEDLERAATEAVRGLDRAAAGVAAARRTAAPVLAAAVEARLQQLAMPRARLEIDVAGDDPADDVRFLLAAGPGEPLLPLAKVASGGELSRTMLALRLALGAAAPRRPDGGNHHIGTLVFDEVDAGIGGEAGLAVGRALSALSAEAQVLVVTHLPQVAAFADAQVAVSKDDHGGRPVARARLLDDEARVVELSRMLSGQPGSSTAQGHAQELLAVAARQRAGAGAVGDCG